LVTGSVARDRASADSDLDVILVVEGGPRRAIEVRVVDGITVELIRTNPAAADATVTRDSPGLKELREASRLATAVAVHDPAAHVARWARLAAQLRPPPALLYRLNDQITEVTSDSPCHVVRQLLDNSALVALSAHPLRYQKPKWVLCDLAEIGAEALRAALIEVYAATDPVDDALAAAGAFLDASAAALELPSWRATVALGYAPQLPTWSYTCRTLADAHSLARDGLAPDAVYTARFAVKLAVTRIGMQRDDDDDAAPDEVLAGLELDARYIAASADRTPTLAASANAERVARRVLSAAAQALVSAAW
jgi:hypothetical protein